MLFVSTTLLLYASVPNFVSVHACIYINLYIVTQLLICCNGPASVWLYMYDMYLFEYVLE